MSNYFNHLLLLSVRYVQDTGLANVDLTPHNVLKITRTGLRTDKEHLFNGQASSVDAQQDDIKLSRPTTSLQPQSTTTTTAITPLITASFPGQPG